MHEREAAIQTTGLTRYFGRTAALHGLSIKIPRGQVTALIGHNGAGKTTLIRTLLGFLPPTRGRSEILGCDSQRLTPQVRARIGYLAEGHFLWPWLKAGNAAHRSSARLDRLAAIGRALAFGGRRPGPGNAGRHRTLERHGPSRTTQPGGCRTGLLAACRDGRLDFRCVGESPMRTILWKELREHARWLPLGLLPMIGAVVLVWRSHELVFDQGGGLLYLVALLGSLIAAALGLAQCWPDKRPAARALLLHGGLTHDTAFFGKLLAGVILYATAVIVPLICLAVFIAMVGLERRAAYPDMVLPAMQLAIAAFTFWPATFLTVRRPAWFLGSRLLPGVTAVVVVIGCMGTTHVSSAMTSIILSVVCPLLGLLAARSAFINSDGQPTGVGRAVLALSVTAGLFTGVYAVAWVIESYRLQEARSLTKTLPPPKRPKRPPRRSAFCHLSQDWERCGAAAGEG